MTRSKEASRKKVLTAAQSIAASITALIAPVTDEQVLAVMKQQAVSGPISGDAFWLLDNEPSRFANHQIWHPRLRSLRNHPTVGEQMFALFSDRDA